MRPGRPWLVLVAAAACLSLTVACFRGDTVFPTEPPEGTASMNLSSFAFAIDGRVRLRYACDGIDISPPLAWFPPPEGTQSLVLLFDDPDGPGGTFTHWLLYDMPPGLRSLQEAIGRVIQELPDGGLQGMTDFGTVGYRGPCPPREKEHTYVFHLYALDKELGLSSRARRADVFTAMEGSIIGYGSLSAVYRRAPRR